MHPVPKFWICFGVPALLVAVTGFLVTVAVLGLLVGDFLGVCHVVFEIDEPEPLWPYAATVLVLLMLALIDCLLE
jgi:hypothetical protein